MNIILSPQQEKFIQSQMNCLIGKLKIAKILEMFISSAFLITNSSLSIATF